MAGSATAADLRSSLLQLFTLQAEGTQSMHTMQCIAESEVAHPHA